MAGPLQVIAVSFGPGADFKGAVMAEVDRLQGRGVLRLLDVLFVAKNEDGTIQRLAVDDEDEDFGALLSSVIGVDGAGFVGSPADGGESGSAPVDAWATAGSLPAGTALALVLIEHSWAQPLFDAIAQTGGTLLAETFLTSEAGVLAGAEVAAIEGAAQVIVAAQTAEVDATLLAMAARTQADETMAALEAVRTAAAAEATRALITAGLVEEAAALEAVEALRAAGLIVAAADEAAAEAAATVKAASITLAQARVLRYLPTPMTFAVIADKLGISRSAAKERAERAYKKLGVHSRAEAVDRARALGLID